MQWAVCRRMPSTQIVAMGVLPKGQTWPNTCTESITSANKRLQEYAEKHKPWLHYIDLGNRFLTHQVRVGPKPGRKIPYHLSKRSSSAQPVLMCESESDSMPAACACRPYAHGMASLPDHAAAKLTHSLMACRMTGRDTRRLCPPC